MNEQTLSNFLDSYIKHTRMLKSSFVANSFMKNVLLIPPDDLMRKRISEINKNLRIDLAKKFLRIFKKRKYKKDLKFYIAD